MKLQFRFLMLFALASIAAFLSLIFEQSYAGLRSDSILQSELKQRQNYFDNLLALDGRSEEQLANDYSFWDEFVSFVANKDDTFGHQNLDTGLETYGVTASWVYRPDQTLRYFTSIDGESELRQINLPATFFSKLTQNKYEHFYTYIGNEHDLIEVRAATIVPSSDPDHLQTPKGFYLVGRLLDSSYQKTLGDLSQATVTLVSDTKPVSPSLHGDTVTFGKELTNWDGSVIASYKSTSHVDVINDLAKQYAQERLMLLLLAIIFLTVIIGSVWHMVLKPISRINRAVKLQDPLQLNKLVMQRTEFGMLAQTIADFFAQKINLAEAEDRKAQLEELNREKTSFLAVAAHELNNPVNNVKLFSEYVGFLIQKDPNDPRIGEQIKRISHQSAKINLLLNDLRAASQGNQNLEVNMREFGFDEFFAEEIAEAQFSNTNHKLHFEGSTGQMIYSDPDRLGQVVVNLIRNAVKYSPDATDVTIKSWNENGNVMFSIKDYGVGISDTDKAHIFDKFYRSSEVSKAYPGLGLGLYVSKNIIEKIGGKIWFESEKGQGTTFFVSLPALNA